jgi:hypothetical protein
MADSFLIIPIGPYPYRAMLLRRELCYNAFNPVPHSHIDNGNFLNQVPGAEAVNQKFRLLAALPVHQAFKGCGLALEMSPQVKRGHE